MSYFCWPHQLLCWYMLVMLTAWKYNSSYCYPYDFVSFQMIILTTITLVHWLSQRIFIPFCPFCYEWSWDITWCWTVLPNLWASEKLLKLHLFSIKNFCSNFSSSFCGFLFFSNKHSSVKLHFCQMLNLKQNSAK